jgi:shikimate kinase
MKVRKSACDWPSTSYIIQMSKRQFRNIALIGFMGTGKSCVGRMVAAHLFFEFVDTDTMIESRACRSIAEIFAQAGETTFRALEKQAVAELAKTDKTVIATGGGLSANAENLASLKEHALVVCLWASPEVIWERVRSQSHRPLLQHPNPTARIAELLAIREPFYRQADVLINTELRSVKEVAQHVLHQFHLVRHEAES